MFNAHFSWFRLTVALRKESVDRNDSKRASAGCACMSLSARRAWIEIFDFRRYFCFCQVALRKESVDRNYAVCADYHKRRLVALRKESVDRNAQNPARDIHRPPPVALRKESVDRNPPIWGAAPAPAVALRKESVDRNGQASRRASGAADSRSPQGERG